MIRTNHVTLNSFAIFRASLIYVLSSLVRAHKTDGFYVRMVTDEIYSYNKEVKKYIVIVSQKLHLKV